MTNTFETNPLQEYFRHPVTHIKLPSGGRWWPAGSIEMSATGELPVFPMTAKDEVLLKTPDALMNGSAVVDVIKSCIPSIKNPWAIPNIDIDAILIAIRIASYGPNMDITAGCPHCKEINDLRLDLNTLADRIPAVPSTIQPLMVNNLAITLRPYSYEFLSKHRRNEFEQQKIVSNVTSSEMTDAEKIAYFTKAFKDLAKHTIDAVGLGIESIQLPDGRTVTDPEHIRVFMDNTDRDTYHAVRKGIVAFGEMTKIDPILTKCQSCGEEFPVEITFDQSDFFE